MFNNYHRKDGEILQQYQNHGLINIKPINNEYINLPSVYEQNKNEKKHLGKPIISPSRPFFLLNEIASHKGKINLMTEQGFKHERSLDFLNL